VTGELVLGVRWWTGRTAWVDKWLEAGEACVWGVAAVIAAALKR